MWFIIKVCLQKELQKSWKHNSIPLLKFSLFTFKKHVKEFVVLTKQAKRWSGTSNARCILAFDGKRLPRICRTMWTMSKTCKSSACASEWIAFDYNHWPFRGWALDLIGHIHPSSSKGHRYIILLWTIFLHGWKQFL